MASRKFNDGRNIQSIYVLTETQIRGQIWPRSKFEKVDVLRLALNPHLLKEETEVLLKQEREATWMKLPVEILVYIMEIINYNYKLSARFLLVNKLFYYIGSTILYRSPRLKAPTFFRFIETISANRKIGTYIRELDLTPISQTGKNAYVAKLLKRSSKSLEIFIAPQTSFGLAPLVSLKNCHKLRVLDLRLVSETLNLEELFKSIQSLPELTHLSFPRSSVAIEEYKSLQWPPKLTFLRLSGGISPDFIQQSSFPETIKKLEFAHCPYLNDLSVYTLLGTLGKNLTHLTVQYPMPGLKASSMDMVFLYCPNLVFLEVTVDYITRDAFDEISLPFNRNVSRPLKTIFIESSGMLGASSKLHPDDITIALMEDRLPNLKNMRVTAKMGWDPKSESMEDLVGLLDERDGGVYLSW